MSMKGNNQTGHWRKLAGIGCLMLGTATGTIYAQVDAKLAELGMENIRTVQTGKGTTVAFEDRAYRSSLTGLGMAIETALNALENPGGLTLVVTDRNGMPQLRVDIAPELAEAYRNGTADLKTVFAQMELNRNADGALKELEGTRTEARSAWRPDLTVYPQVFLENTSLNKLYTFAVGLAPTLEMPLWKGGELTAQVILPIAWNLNGEQSQIRPGCVTLSQSFYLKRKWTLTATAGQFTNHRMGAQADALWRTDDGRWELGAKAGVTVYSLFADKEWTVTRQPKLNASVYGRTYIPQWNLEVEGEAARFVYGDYGVKGSAVRHFGEYTVGVFAMVAGGKLNGGFNFAIPLPGKKYKRWKGMRIKPADYFAFQYNMVAHGEYINRKLGREYNTVPGSNRSQGFYQPDFIRYYLTRHCDKIIGENQTK